MCPALVDQFVVGPAEISGAALGRQESSVKLSVKLMVKAIKDKVTGVDEDAKDLNWPNEF